MNGKQAKKLRREAEALTIGKPNKAYRVVEAHTIRGVQKILYLKEDCTRAIYKELKKQFKTGELCL